MPPVTWFLRPSLFSEQPLVDALGCPPFIARLLTLRGLTDPADARLFLDPRLKNLSDPFLLPGMRPAIARILQAIDRRERIVLYGDYDVDGVTSLALFTRILRALGADPHPFLPHRMDEGYGLTPDGVARCVTEHQPQLLLALDCGTAAVAEIAALRAQGVDVLVFDHHESKGDHPAALALVNPKLGTDFHYLCSAGIVFKACHALLKERPAPGVDLRDYLDIVALGTVADIVPLKGENRILVQRGLLQLEKSRWTGIRALIDSAGIAPPFSPPDIGFKLGPRINAAGRLASAEQALELLLTEDHARARELAAALSDQNRERQEVEKAIHAEAESIVEKEFNPAHAAIVVGRDGWHPGVLGIVAARLSRAHHRATFVIGFDETGLGKGSGRSIEGLSMVKALAACSDSLVKFGGHEMAAGLTIRRENFPQFQDTFRREARALLTDDQLRPRLYLDAELPLSDLHFDFLRHHDTLQPFGIGNSQPVFLARNIRSAETRILKEKHYRFMLVQNGGGHSQPAIYFGGALRELPPQPWDIAFQVSRNDYNDRVTLQLEIKDLRPAEALP
ncbi:MAG: single-stranded-DNA-specific exonuclease RecJ [Chthoniobacteraceae bacterium]|jgi:single-stranded-DNA-specific exonuclease